MPPLRSFRGGHAAAVLAAWLLVACTDGPEAASAAPAPAPATPNSATLRISPNPVQTVQGAARDVSLSFDSDDGGPLRDVALSTAALPAGWSAAGPTACGSAGEGRRCVVRLRHAPAAPGSGTLRLDYRYRDSSGAPRQASTRLTYAATAHNNIVASVDPESTLWTRLGASRTLRIRFATDNGSPATALDFGTSLAALPAGFSAGSGASGCARVSRDDPCTLTLTHHPDAVASGSVELAYTYRDDSGGARRGSVAFDYRATSGNRVLATPSLDAPLSTTVGASRSFDIAFTTDDGERATALALTTPLASLGGGFASAEPGFGCAAVGASADACVLRLVHTPASLGSGTLRLDYAYLDNSGSRKTGHLNLAYVNADHNRVVAQAEPAADIDVKVGTSQALRLAFTTDDGLAAGGFEITTDLAALPDGWTAAAPALACATLPGACAIDLQYQPAQSGNGVLALDYTYRSSDGTPRTGRHELAYAAHREWVYVAESGAGAVQRCAWSSDGLLSDCQLAAGGLAGATATVLHGARALVGRYGDALLARCDIGSGGTLDACAPAGEATSAELFGLALRGDDLYVASHIDGRIVHCTLGADGAPAGCSTAATGLIGPTGMAVRGDALYVTAYSNSEVLRCPIASGGSLGACSQVAAVNGASGIAFWRDHAFIATISWDGLTRCAVAADGSFDTCTAIPIPTFYGYGIAVSAGSLLVGNYGGGDVLSCSVGDDGSVGACQDSGAGFAQPAGLTVVHGP